VRWHGRQPPRDAWRVADGAWAGLLLLDDTPAFRDALPSKLFEYVACGLAVVTTALPRSASLVAETGAGVVVADAQEAAAVLRRWSAAPEELEALRTAARAARGAVDGHDELVAFAGAIREAVSRTSRRAPAAGQPRA
jgi:glycosyltransferase involved in cell wall biosynthesis